MAEMAETAAGQPRQYGGLGCCQDTVDPVALLSIVGGIAGVTYILRQAVINKIAGRRKRSVATLPDALDTLSRVVRKGE